MSSKKKSKKKKRPGAHYRRSRSAGKTMRRAKNPMFGMGKKRRHSRRGRNPLLPIPGGDFGRGLVGVVTGGLGARMIPENVPFLAKYNTGAVGYGLNLAATVAIAKVAKYFIGSKAEEGAYYGGVLMTISRFISDRFGKVVVTFGTQRLGSDPAFNLRMGKYFSAQEQPLSPLPVPTPYVASGPVPPLPVGSPPGAIVPAAPATAKAAMTTPTTIAAATSMGYYGGAGGRYGKTRFM